MPKPLFSHVLNLRKDVPAAGSITTGMLADGAVTWAKIGEPTYARIARSTNQSCASGATTLISFDTLWGPDPAGMWSAGAPTRLTVPKTGFYLFGGSITSDASAGGARRLLLVQVSGVTFAASEAPPPTARGLAVATGGYLAAAQYIEIGFFHDAGAALNAFQPSFIWCARVG